MACVGRLYRLQIDPAPARVTGGMKYRKLPQLRRSGGADRKLVVTGSMYVPSDSFGGLSPERKAANALRNLFTFIAARVILAQLEGSGRGGLGSYDVDACTLLTDCLQNVPLKDGDEWVDHLLKRNSILAYRLMEVRDAYCNEEFEWDTLKRLAAKDTKEANLRLLRNFAAKSLTKVASEEPSASE